jgi:hypothetical protein
MATMSVDIAACVDPVYRVIHNDAYNKKAPQYPHIVNILSSTKIQEKESLITGFGKVPKKDKGTAISYDDPIEGLPKTFIHDSYGMGFRVTREAHDDDLFGKMDAMPKKLGESAKETIEGDIADIYNYAFTDSSAYHGPDGKPLVHASHPLLDGGTGSNVLATPADLSVTSVQLMMTLLEDTVNERNINAPMTGTLLVVPAGERFTVREILHSTDRPDTANRAKNVLTEDNLKFIVVNRLTDADAWFLIDEEQYKLNMYFRQRPIFESGNDFDTKDGKFSTFFRFSRGWVDWKGVAGTAGAA